MLHAAVLRSPHASARVKEISLERALAAPGVRAAVGPGGAVVLADETGFQGQAVAAAATVRPAVRPGGIGVLTDEPGFQGQAVAAVAADTIEQARKAIELVEIEWEVREPVLDPDEAVRRGQLVGGPNRYERGDVDRALAEADVVVEAEYRTQTVLHNSMETHQSICEWQGDRLDIYISTQSIWGVRDEVAATLGLSRDKVRVVCEFMGGGFGSKNGANDHTYIAAELARRTGRPVRCALTRREENLAAGNRNSTIQRLTAGARSDGTLVALVGEYVNATGWDGWASSTDGPMQMLYDCENIRTALYPAKINTPPMKAFRAPGFVEGTFGLECLLDELAARLEMDPLELRRLNYANSTDDRPYSSKNLMECYRRAEPHWERRDEVRGRSEGPWKRGVGLASQVWYGGGGPPCYAWVRLGSDGRATVITAMQDIGTGTATAMAQVAAEELGLPLDRIDFVFGDSARGPYAVTSAGSSTMPSMGPAVRSAAADAARQVLEIAAQRYEQEEGALSLDGGNVVSSDGGSWPIEEVVGLLEDAQILGQGARGPNPTGMQVLTFGVQVADVAVDVETGEVRVERVVAIHDVGRVINPLGASSQVEGGIIQGIGHTLSEDRLIDPQSGITLNQTLDAYKLPTIADVPEIVTDLLDIPDEHLTNLGSKGLGEPPIVPTAAAIANAIRDATGADVRSLPISREEMLRALAEAREKEKREAPATV
jgi:xanthine dehydrogenase YagR molybdenum-binding subunit